MNVDELERTLLDAARSDLSPSFVDRERHQMELLARLDGAQPWQGLPNAPRPVKASAWRALGSREFVSGAPLPWARWKLLSVGLALGVLLGGLIGFGLGRRSQTAQDRDLAHAPSAPAGSKAAAVAAQAPGTESGPDAPSPLVPSPSPDADGTVDPGQSPLHLPTAELEAADVSPLAADRGASARAVASASKGLRHGSARRQSALSSDPLPQSSLGIELSMLQRARRALNAENGRLALGIVEELDERFPAGILLEERTATRILSLCKLDRVEEARRVAGVFLGRYPGSVYAARVRESCASRVGE